MAVDEPQLSDLGTIQAERAAERLAGERFDQIFVSPLTRALQTARPICGQIGMQAQVLPWLAELGHPPLAGAGAEQVDAFFRQATLRPPEAWWDGLPGGESFRVFTERVQTGLAQLLAGFGISSADASGHRIWRVPERDLRLLFVAHVGTGGVMLSYLLNTPVVPWIYTRFNLGYTGLWRMETAPLADGVVWSLRSFNDRDHLRDLPESPR
jgi:probable phosphoglycerate mutase